MGESISEEAVRGAIAGVKHPAIDRTLLELGIVKEISVQNDKAAVLLAFPFPNIPIRDQLIDSLREPIEGLGAEVEFKVTVMTQEELQRFLALEADGWKGGV